MKRLTLLAFSSVLLFLWLKPSVPETFRQEIIHTPQSLLPVWDPDYRTARTVAFEWGEANEQELEGVQCPIPMKDRVKNYTQIQCVFASLECLGRWADCKQLTEPPITSRSDCKSYSGPSDAASKLKRLGIRFEMSYRDREKGIALIKKSMSEGRGVLWGVPGHAMVLCHFDEEKGVVKYINNSNYKLPIQTMSMSDFHRRWDTWVVAIYAEPDLFPTKLQKLSGPNLIPIVDRNGPQQKHPLNYIPVPEKK
jgi:hypothetical protein